MADGGGGNSGLAFIVGGLLVVVLVLGLFVFSGGMPFAPEKKSVDININPPNVEAPKVPGT